MGQVKIICLVGMPGGGKGETSRILKSNGIPTVLMSDIVREEMRKRGIELNVKNLDATGSELRKEFGPGIVAKRTVGKLKLMKDKIVCVDGVRNTEEITLLKDAGNVKIVHVDAPESARFKRIIARNEARDAKTFEDFKWRERKQKEFGVGKVIETADYAVDNDGSLEELRKKVEKLLADIAHV